jgi:hypothetical protein
VRTAPIIRWVSDSRRGKIAAVLPNNTSCSVIRTGADNAASLLELVAASWLTSPTVADIPVNCDISPP